MLLTTGFKVGIVNYLNTQPVLYGLEKEKNNLPIELIKDYPARIGEMLVNDTIDIGLIPVAMLPKIKEAKIISNYCIGATNAVASVCIFSEKPLHELKTILLDYQSRTSVVLTKILIKEYWKLNVEFVAASNDFIDEIKGSTGALVIGDRALKLRNKKPFVYDLAEAWINFTQLPFVFAAWVANKPIPQDFIKAFDAANELGFNFLNEIVQANNYPFYDLHTYYTQNISYKFNVEKQKGLERFLQLLASTTN